MSAKSLLLVLLFLVALYLPALGAPASGTHPDESYYLGISAEMDARGEWLTPTIDGQRKWFKPPLLYWAERVTYGLFGRGFFGGRLPVALSSVALALLVGSLARRMHGERAVLPATLLVATTFGSLKFGRMAMLDIPMTLAFAAVAWGVWRASEEDHPPSLLWVGLGAGASFLLKGPVGPVIILLFAGGFLLVRAPKLLVGRWTVAAFLLGACIGLPWYVVSLIVHGRAFYDFFVLEQNVARFTAPWTFSGELTLLVGFFVFLLPWSLLVLGQLPALRSVRRDPALLLCATWMGAVLLVFTVPALKWPHYGLMCAPAAILLAVRSDPPAWARVGTAMILGLLGVTVLLVLRWRLPVPAVAGLLGAGGLLIAGGLLAMRGRMVDTSVVTGAGFALLLGIVVPSVNPPVIPTDALAHLAGRELYVHGSVPGIFTMSAGRAVRRVEAGSELERALASGGVVIMAERSLPQLGESGRDLVPVTTWRRIPGYLPARAVVRSWLRRDESLLFEPMFAMERAPPDGR